MNIKSEALRRILIPPGLALGCSLEAQVEAEYGEGYEKKENRVVAGVECVVFEKS